MIDSGRETDGVVDILRLSSSGSAGVIVMSGLERVAMLVTDIRVIAPEKRTVKLPMCSDFGVPKVQHVPPFIKIKTIRQSFTTGVVLCKLRCP